MGRAERGEGCVWWEEVKEERRRVGVAAAREGRWIWGELVDSRVPGASKLMANWHTIFKWWCDQVGKQWG